MFDIILTCVFIGVLFYVAWFKLIPANVLREEALARQVELEDSQKALEIASSDRDKAESERNRAFLLLRAAKADRRRLWDLVERAMGEERKALQMQVNFAYQGRGSTPPYPDAPHMPPNEVHKPQEGGPVGRKGRMLTSQIYATRVHEVAMRVAREAEARATGEAQRAG